MWLGSVFIKAARAEGNQIAVEKGDYFDLSLKSNLDDQTRKPDEFVLVCDGELTEELDSIIEKYERKYPDIISVYRLNQNHQAFP